MTAPSPPTPADLRRALARPLPGLPAQLGMVPASPLCSASGAIDRLNELRDRTPPSSAKEAGVLLLFYPHRGQLHLPLTRRAEGLENHQGQISLPGGAREGDESLQTTALRETCEELGVCHDGWELLGRLSPLYIPPSGFLINPFAAYTPARPTFEPDPIEVAELIETPLLLLLDPDTMVWEEWLIRDQPTQVPFFHVYGHKVWGATAMVLSELISLLRDELE